MTSSSAPSVDTRRRLVRRRAACGLLAIAITFAACGSDDDSAQDEATPEATAAASDQEATGSETGAGTLTFEFGGSTLEAAITSCDSPNETQVSITAAGETAQVVVQPAADNQVAVTVSGSVEFEGTGTAVVDDAGGVTITGNGAPADPGAEAGPFTVSAQIAEC